MTKIKIVLVLCFLIMLVTFASLKAGEDPYSLLIDNIVNLKRIISYSLQEQADSMVKFNHYDGSTTIRVAKDVELIKDPPDVIDNYDIIGLRYHFKDGTIHEVFFKPDEKSEVNR